MNLPRRRAVSLEDQRLHAAAATRWIWWLSVAVGRRDSPPDIADLFGDLSSHEDIVAFQCLEPELAARTFEHLERSSQDNFLRILPEGALRGILSGSKPDDRTALLEGLTEDEVERLLTLLTPDRQRIARSLLSYGEGTVAV